MKLICYGAAGTVTGSCHLLKTRDYSILVDCGFFQGKGLFERNEEEFGFDPSKIDFLLLTHAHIDHIGRVPMLVKRGFQGRIVTTAATYDFARIMLLESAELQEETARREKRKNNRGGEEPTEPLYNVEDVLDCLDFFDTFVTYDARTELDEGLHVTFRDAGHILGSAFIEVEVAEGRGKKAATRRITFSGDLGNLDKPLIRDPQIPSESDIVVLESTYGGRDHRPFDDSVEEFRKAIVETLERGGNVLIPSFALERSQELLYVLYGFYRAGDLPRCTIYLDSPMAIDCTRIFAKHGDCFDEEALALSEAGGNPFHFEALRFTRHTDDSRAINNHTSGAIIIAGSGMCTGGRILHHLRHNLWRPECSVIFVGYAAVGTTGRAIIDGVNPIRLYGESVQVRAQIHTINGFSGHAGQRTLLDWLERTGQPEKVILVHGEDSSREALSHAIGEKLGLTTVLPGTGDVIEI